MEKQDPALFEIYRKLMWHFYIYLDIHHVHGSVNSFKSWADYLFPILDGAPKDIQVPVADEHISKMMASRAQRLIE